DNANEVTGDIARSFSYDGAGNRNMVEYTIGAANRISSDGTWTYTYDSEGYLEKRSKGANAETWNFGYDSRGQLDMAEQRATDGGTLQLKLVEQYDVYSR